MRRRFFLGPAAAFLVTTQVLGVAATLDVRNPYGGISLTIVAGGSIRIGGSLADEPLTSQHVAVERIGERVRLRMSEPPGGKADLEVDVPLGFELVVETRNGDIRIEGMTHRARLRTNDGAISIHTVWEGARLIVDSDEPIAAADFSTPSGVKFGRDTLLTRDGAKFYRIYDKLSDRAVTYGSYRIEARRPRRVELGAYRPPPEWPLKFHWRAEDVYERLLANRRRPPPPPPEEEASDEPGGEGGVLFRSDVRMVNFVVTVKDSQGRPVTDLTGEDFEVVENGVEQKVAFAGSDDTPFNVAILLDLSGSSQPDLEHIREAARRFVRMAGPNDKVAIYALAGGMFRVVSRLTNDRQELLRRIDRLPRVTGPTPLYDAILLAYGEELEDRVGERNALIVLSDGIDNGISKQEAPSSVKFKRFRDAAERMEAVLYPIFLLSGERFGRGWSVKARRNLEELTARTGGLVFPAASLEDLEPVFPKVEAELRSVYGVAYYPSNQEFDGSWRPVTVRAARKGVTIRARPGYWAR